MDLTLKKLIGRLNGVCYGALEAAAGACVNRGGDEIVIEDLLLQLVDRPDSDLALLLAEREIDASRLRAALQHEIEQLPTSGATRPVFSTGLIGLLEEAWLYASVELEAGVIRSAAIAVALRGNKRWYGGKAYADSIGRLPLDFDDDRHRALLARSVEADQGHAAGASTQAAGEQGVLERFTEDFTDRARRGDIDPVLGRDREVRQLLDILGRRHKNNPILVGEAGVGKTAIVEGFAQRIAAGDVTPNLADARVLALDLGELQAGAGVRGEFEKRISGLVREMGEQGRPVVLFVDEAHVLIGAGADSGGGDAANLLKPALARGHIKVIAATTWSEYRRYFEKDAALARRFQPVQVDEPSVEQTTTILRGLHGRYEEAHDVYIRDDALAATARLSARYITGRNLPDKAVDVLDTACARVTIGRYATPASLERVDVCRQALEREREAIARDVAFGAHDASQRLDEIAREITDLGHQREALWAAWSEQREAVEALIDARRARDSGQSGSEAVAETDLVERRAAVARASGDETLVPYEVNPEIVSRVVADWTGIPLGRLVHDESPVLAQLERFLGESVRGQDGALSRIAERLRAAKAGLTEPNEPLGVFLLCGPSGVGKTETAISVAKVLFGGEHALTTINMSEFQERNTVSRLIGSAPGYVGYGEGGVLTEAIRQRPYSVVLLDEIEKAHPEVLNLFYQLFDKGVLNDGEGRSIDFRNTAVFLTSNLGSEAIVELADAEVDFDEETLAEAVKPALLAHVPPALLARMAVVPYRPVPTDILADIVRGKLERIAARLREAYGHELEVGDSLIQHILERCNTREEGARNVEAIINRDVVPGVARDLLARPGDVAMALRCRLEVTQGGVTTQWVGGQ